MAWAPLLLLLLAHCTVVNSQNVVTQEASLSITPGGTVTLTCGSSAGAVTTSNYAQWVQQKPYQVPRGLIGNTSNRVPGVPARFSGSLQGNKAALTITGAQAEDEAEYYCALWFSNHYVFGSGTKVTVIGQPKSAPTVTLFPPSSEEISTNQVTLVCMINGFYPSDVVVTWTGDGIPLTQGVDTTKPMKQSDNKYAASSYLSLTRREWESRNQFVCKVTHEGTTIEKTVSPA